jgi:hypothetical protein
MQLSTKLEQLIDGAHADHLAELKHILADVFCSPILLSESCSSIEECIEFAEIRSIIDVCIGDLEGYGLSLLPVLGPGDLSIFVSEMT